MIEFYPYIIDRDLDMQLMDTELCVHCDVPDAADSPGFESIVDAKKALPALAYKLQEYFFQLEENFLGFGIMSSDGYRWQITQGEYEKLKHIIRFIPYVIGENERKIFLWDNYHGLLTTDQDKAWGAPTLEYARARVEKIHRAALAAKLSGVVTKFGVYDPEGEDVHFGWSDLMDGAMKGARFYPYVLDTYGGKTYLTASQEGFYRWTQFLSEAQAFPTVEIAKEHIQHLVEIVREEEDYSYFDVDLHAGVVDGFEDTVFEDYIVGPVPPIHETEGSDPVNNPEHYKTEGLEAIDVVEAFFADNYLRGNVFKYIARAGKKDPNKKVEDLQKAAWYLNREIEALKGDCA